jgi:D-alanyl-D-alanine carboxypeptidase
MLFDYEGSSGIKTGYTKKAGRCLVTSCKRDGLELISVVLNCPPMYEKSKNLLDSCFSSYSNYKLVESDNILGFSTIKDTDQKVGLCIKNDIILPLTIDEYKNIEIKYNYNEIIEKPVKNFDENGYIEIYCKNNLIFKEKIYTIFILK